MIDTIVFDIGNVLAAFSWEKCLRERGFDEELILRVGDATVNTKLWKELDRSTTISEELIRQFITQDPEIADSIREFLSISYDSVREYDYSSGLIEKLKTNGYKVYLLSNYNGINYEHAKKNFSFINKVDGGVISYEIGIVKPDLEIYEALIAKYSITPSETVFLDDIKENTDAAASLGFHTVHFKDLDNAITELRSLKIIL
ncbi:MAG TPA: HAD family phosphatase [Mobilitalea sp.]|nr:HAD family phosphatase [Mobilitalea sp.]